MKKLVKNIKWIDVRIGLISLMAIILFSFTNQKNQSREVKEIKVNFKNEDSHFVTSEDIRNLIENNLPNTSYVNRTIVDLNNLEDAVLNNKLVGDAEVYLNVNGEIIVEIWQKKAIGRVVSHQNSFYIDEHGEDMPLSDVFSKRVPLVQGDISNENRNSIQKMLVLISNDNFLQSDLAGIVIENTNNVSLISRNNKFQILFGSFDEMERKLNNYKAFVQYGLHEEIGIEQYKKINLQFTQQVVCTK